MAGTEEKRGDRRQIDLQVSLIQDQRETRHSVHDGTLDEFRHCC